MREIDVNDIVDLVKDGAIRGNIELEKDILDALKKAKEEEESSLGKNILDDILSNAAIAKTEKIPLCQDTGIAVFFVELGQDVRLVGGDLYAALEEGIRRGYREGYLRKSVCHPFTRKNTGDNTPPIIHLDLVPGDRLTIYLLLKGGGSENMSRLYMLSPSDGWQGVKAKIVQTVVDAGPNPCPPTIVGVGIGGNFEQCALLSKKATLRPLGEKNPDPELDSMEQELLDEINRTGIGPQGMGGSITSLAVHILMMPCHIASLPVAVNMQCHSFRHVKIEL